MAPIPSTCVCTFSAPPHPAPVLLAPFSFWPVSFSVKQNAYVSVPLFLRIVALSLPRYLLSVHFSLFPSNLEPNDSQVLITGWLNKVWRDTNKDMPIPGGSFLKIVFSVYKDNICSLYKIQTTQERKKGKDKNSLKSHHLNIITFNVLVSILSDLE